MLAGFSARNEKKGDIFIRNWIFIVNSHQMFSQMSSGAEGLSFRCWFVLTDYLISTFREKE